MVLITDVIKGSPAEKHGIHPGDYLVSVNGNEIADVLDYRFYLCEKKLHIITARDGTERPVDIKKGEYDDIGLEFETFLMDKKHSCRNKCIFCFIDQLPRGMRDTLYFKDDDSRLSFLQGNYITMTNLDDADIDRIIKMKMSPINISVHTTNPELRVFMLKNPNAGKSLSYLKRFADAGTEMNCQIVLCRGVNDGAELERTMHDLACLYPAVTSVSVVPAGMTCYREGLYPLTPFSRKEAAAVVAQVETFAAGCLSCYGERIFFAADELYIAAGLPLPDAEYYEGFRQLENGVGMMASMKEEFDAAISQAQDDGRKREVSVATGAAAYSFIRGLCARIEEKFSGIHINVYQIDNHYFGESITVAGLLTGQDILEQLRGKPLGEALFIPMSSLRYEGDLFLCGMSVSELSEALGVEVEPCANDGYEFLDKITGNL
jgi:hypothetical protein